MAGSSILYAMKDGQASETPKNMELNRSIPPLMFANTVGTFEPHICINQLNGKSVEKNTKILAAWVNKVVNR